MPIRSIVAGPSLRPKAEPIRATERELPVAAAPASLSLANAERFGHDFARLPAPGSLASTGVLQRATSDEEGDDADQDRDADSDVPASSRSSSSTTKPGQWKTAYPNISSAPAGMGAKGSTSGAKGDNTAPVASTASSSRAARQNPKPAARRPTASSRARRAAAAAESSDSDDDKPLSASAAAQGRRRFVRAKRSAKRDPGDTAAATRGSGDKDGGASSSAASPSTTSLSSTSSSSTAAGGSGGGGSQASGDATAAASSSAAAAAASGTTLRKRSRRSAAVAAANNMAAAAKQKGGESSGSDADDESEPEEQEDEDYTEKRAGDKAPVDPDSEIKKGTRKEIRGGLAYQTKGGAEHAETFDDTKLARKTTTKGLQYKSGVRNPAYRPKPGQGLKVYNPHGLSTGQSGLNQMVVSHSSPSWGGMRAGREYGNSSLTSPVFNSEIEKAEKPIREKIGERKKFTYSTATQYEKIDPQKDAKDIAPALEKVNPRWDEKRVAKRLGNVLNQVSASRRVRSEDRSITDDAGKELAKFSKGRDLLFGIPRRAYDKDAHDAYIKARGQDSEGSDKELLPPADEVKRKKKRAREKRS